MHGICEEEALVNGTIAAAVKETEVQSGGLENKTHALVACAPAGHQAWIFGMPV